MMRVKCIEQTDSVFQAVQELVQKQFVVDGLVSIEDISKVVDISSEEIFEKLDFFIEKDIVFESRKDFSKPVIFSDRIFGVLGHSLSVGFEYTVLGVECGSFRIVNDCGTPTLFDPFHFEVIDCSRPDFWITEYDEGDEYSYPAEWKRQGFFEDYFNGNKEVVAIFDTVLKEKYS